MANSKLNEESLKVIQGLNEMFSKKSDWAELIESKKFVTVKEALTTQDASILIPKVMTSMIRDTVEPMYIGSKLLEKVRLTEGRSMEFPSMGALRAHNIGETQSYPEETLDFQMHRTEEVRVGKTGLITRVSEELIRDSQWDVIGILVRKSAEAMMRLKEEMIFNQFSSHGHRVFDNDIREQYAQSGTTGLDKNGKENNTMSSEDIIDMFINIMSNGYNPTDILLHPLSWSVFFKNDVMDSLTHAALGGSQITNLSITPDQVSGRIPFAINMQMSPFIPFNHKEKKFDMYVVDANNIGILLEKDALTIEEFADPERDIQSIKMKERFGIGILDEGKAVSVAANLAFERTYPEPQTVRITN